MAVYRSGHILKITSISEPFPHGQFLSMAVLEYDRDISNQALSPTQFTVKDRTITSVYANKCPERSQCGTDGRYVILELSLRDQDAHMLRFEDENGRVLISPPPMECFGVRAENRVEVEQCGSVTASDGTVLPPVKEQIVSSEAVNRVVDDFSAFEYEDIAYSLYIPKNYDPAQKYPLVLFIPDASAMGSDPILPLLQGIGATAFASPRDQALHPSFVLTPALPFSYKITSKVGVQGARHLVNKLIGLLDHVCAQYSVDPNRIYTTGQSLGCIASCVLNVCHPDRFAATLLVVGQWDAAEMAALSKKNFWLITSDGDARAYPSMNAMVEGWEKTDAKIGIYRWNAKEGPAALSKLAQQAAAQDQNIRYTIFENCSVVPDGVENTPITNHVHTWPTAYAIDAIRDWLFTNSLSTGADR